MVVSAGILVLASTHSCTHDYFEDETNYLVFVKEVMDKTATDCRVMVYNEAGELSGMRYASYPFEKDPRIKAGLFGFRLPPGEYKVYCYTNTDSVSFVEENTLNNCAFMLKNCHAGENHYVQPSDIRFRTLKPTIPHYGVRLTDSVNLEQYTAQVTVKFKNFPGEVSHIKQVELNAERAATRQYLRSDTLTSHCSAADIEYNRCGLPVQDEPGFLVVNNRFFPTVADDVAPLRLNYAFYDESGNIVNTIPIDLKDKETGENIRLLHGQHLIITVDTYFVVKIEIEGWDEQIEGGNTNME